MLPKHNNPTSKERTAWAPYNFVPLPDRPFTAADDGRSILNPDQGVYDVERRLTGWLDIRLETRAPVYVRGPLTPAEHETKERQEAESNEGTAHLQKMRNKPEFFHTGDPNAPVIPGSSLRGMIRTICEILGHGKFGPAPERPLVYRAVGDISSHGEAYRKLLMDEQPGQKNWFIPKYQGGFIRKGTDGWYIQPAEVHNGATWARVEHSLLSDVAITGENQLTKPKGHVAAWHKCKNAREVYVKLGLKAFKPARVAKIERVEVSAPVSAVAGAGLQKAVLTISGRIPRKHSEAVIFLPDVTKTQGDGWIPISEDPGDRLYGDIVSAYRDQGTPDQKALLGKDSELRDEWQYQPVFYLLDQAGNLIFFGHTQMFRLPYRRPPTGFLPASFTDEGRIDLAEAMFGKVRGENSGQAGRVFVGDARLEPGQSDPWLPGGEIVPKILSSPKPTTFQHYLTQPRPDVSDGKGLETYNSDPRSTTLRGYKLYWHKRTARREDIEEKPGNLKNPDLYTRMKPVRSGLSFTFRVWFENLLLQELGLLWWALALSPDGDYCHSLGMGKPYGLGAVKLTPTLHLVDPQRRYGALLDGTGWVAGEVDAATAQRQLELSKQQFEQFITKSQQQQGVSFAQLERVRMLLEMLRWPGPNPQNTGYMEIERWENGRKTNEYRGRPVLPDPLRVK
ncbi:RNA binding S1 domain protein [Candidatus Promineifilum breve]|uniref:RNA binding S1 domain protein n=1 Tax=Candidatus Promineifilum breve TaxID=1806508 RepID=A0A160T4M7_9CHLR|nr:TIGR03986 family CRISPR-associated RAMP protein [Candidatus Promineifilum breve]CUS05066.2 RNA binding S1 domain protein [Candidatus Promineifilum breve]